MEGTAVPDFKLIKPNQVNTYTITRRISFAIAEHMQKYLKNLHTAIEHSTSRQQHLKLSNASRNTRNGRKQHHGSVTIIKCISSKQHHTHPAITSSLASIQPLLSRAGSTQWQLT
jgi:hypothetical protein